MRILQVNMTDQQGGAAQVAWNLHRQYNARGHQAFLAVSSRQSTDASVFELPKIPTDAGRNPVQRALLAAARRLQPRGRRRWRRPSRLCVTLVSPPPLSDIRHGYYEFYSPGSRELERLSPQPPDVIHCHNLHGDYFDLRLLATLSQRRPVMLTLHDAWLMTGHCAHAMGCDRWLSGCGHCPDLSIYPAMRKDLTAYAWRAKQAVYARSRLFVASPAQWLADTVKRSMMQPAVVESRVIPNGVDTGIFRPGDRQAARAHLGIRPAAKVVLFVADGIRTSSFKDFTTLREAFGRLAAGAPHEDLLFLALGEAAPTVHLGRAELRSLAYSADRVRTASYYQAADVYAHAARADTFPNTVIEALACGTPVAATAVGGITEQIRGLGGIGDNAGTWARDEATGALVPPGMPAALASALARLLDDESLRQQLGANAARDAAARFSLERQADAYLRWYDEIMARPKEPSCR